MIRRIVSHPLFSGSTIMVAGSMAVNAINYIYHLLMGRIMEPPEYGLLYAIFSLLYIVSIVPLSTGIAITKFVSEAKNQSEVVRIYHGINTFIFKVAIISSIVLMIISPVIGNFLHIDNMLLVLLVAPILFLSLITLVNQMTAQGLIKFMGVVGPNFVSAVAKLILGLIFVYIGLSVFGAIVGVLLAAFFAYLYSITFVKKYIGKKSRQDFDLKPFLKFALPSLLQALAFTAYFTVDVLLVRHFLPEFEVGLYAALSTLGKVIYFAVNPITSAMFPIVTGRKSRGESYKSIFVMSFLGTLVLSSAIISFYYFLPNIAIRILYGTKYLMATEELFLMGLFIVFYSLSFLLMNYLLSIGKIKGVLFPLAIVPFQIFLIFLYHTNIAEIIRMNLISMTILFVGLSFYLAAVQLKERYAKG